MMQKLLSILVLLTVSRVGVAQQNNLSDDYRMYLAEIRTYYKSPPPFPKMAITPDVVNMVRAMMDKPQKTVLNATQQTIDGPYGKIDLRIFRPQITEAVYLDIHGGGHLWGSPISDDSLNDLLARTCHVAVVSVDYHLAPEYPFPAQIADCNATAKWLLANAKTSFGTDKIFIRGGSAGAQLAATTILYVRDSLHAADRVIGVGLHNGLFDLGETPSHRSATDSTPGLSKWALNEIMRVLFGRFTMEERQSEKFSPCMQI
jgi:acetyl esterase/lipase